jgi:hypothetical protein
MSFALQLLGIASSGNMLEAITAVVYLGEGGYSYGRTHSLEAQTLVMICIMNKLFGKFFDSCFRLLSAIFQWRTWSVEIKLHIFITSEI